MILFLDPGHGGRHPGCMRPPWSEAADVLEVAQLARQAIAGTGWPVTIHESRCDNNTTLGLSVRAQKAAEAQADLVISLHVDDSPDPRERGPFAMLMPNAGQLERVVASAFLASLGRPGVAFDTHGNQHTILAGSLAQTHECSPTIGNWRNRAWQVLSYHDRPCVLFEQGRCSNTEELEWLKSQEGKLQRAEAIRSAVCAALLLRKEIGE